MYVSWRCGQREADGVFFFFFFMGEHGSSCFYKFFNLAFSPAFYPSFFGSSLHLLFDFGDKRQSKVKPCLSKGGAPDFLRPIVNWCPSVLH